MIKKLTDKYHRDGLTSLLRSAPKYVASQSYMMVWSRFPKSRRAVWNEVVVPPEVAPEPRITDKLIPAPVRTDYPKSEGGEVEGHKHYTQVNDHVVIIGGGRGVTAVWASKAVGLNGSVIVYEGGLEQVDIVRQVAHLNGVANRIKVRHALVGPGLSVYGTYNGAERINPTDIPDCDVLELDCEGAEAEILPQLQVRPRVIILEIHARDYDDPWRWKQDLSQIGYEIVDRRTNNGKALTKSEFHREILANVEGNASSPVVTAIREGLSK